ncbi:Lcl C-terminal domain-containing protein [Chitinimonas sp. BJB300]|uniref:Lcl C-terminal domain-containing protein n=1 Tax=Chitinimonas sp. BJB300 TaxID=1559339 RepID=UPI0013042B84|nr:DUF1566 domain-containing protein [Chitinimonas sp. BJB300]
MKKYVASLIAAASCHADIAVAVCDKNKPASTPTSHFVLKEGEAFDPKTKLTWARCSVGATWKGGACVGDVKPMQLDEAKKYAQKLGKGWRVPTVEELYGIVEHQCSNPAVNAVVFPNIRSLGEGAPYWSLTTVKGMSPLVYYVDFLSGEVDGHTKGFALGVRLVRSGK